MPFLSLISIMELASFLGPIVRAKCENPRVIVVGYVLGRSHSSVSMRANHTDLIDRSVCTQIKFYFNFFQKINHLAALEFKKGLFLNSLFRFCALCSRFGLNFVFFLGCWMPSPPHVHYTFAKLL